MCLYVLDWGLVKFIGGIVLYLYGNRLWEVDIGCEVGIFIII